MCRKMLESWLHFMYRIFMKNCSNHASSQTKEANCLPAKVHNAYSSIHATNIVFVNFK